MMQEDSSQLSAGVLDLHRAIDSLREEMEAVDFYNQRSNVCNNEELKAILIHNMNEEKEHAAMLIEWIRRNDKEMEHELKENLFTE
ncbi:ferritin, partial [Patescibacteria group bacterium]|nr:ferritin [Patescibacteria group bacterium]